MIQWLERYFRRTNFPGDEERAISMAKMLKDRGKDVPIPVMEAIKNDSGQLVPIINTPNLVFRGTPEYDVLIATHEKITAEANNLTTLQESLHSITFPYYLLFLDRVPKTEKKKKLWRRPDPNEVKTVSWEDSEEVRDLQMRYRYNLSYHPNDPQNRIVFATLELNSQHDKGRGRHTEFSRWDPPVPKLQMCFKGGETTQLILRWAQARPDALLKLTEKNPLGKLLHDSFIFGHSEGDISILTIDLLSLPQIRIDQIFEDAAGSSIQSTFKFDSENNDFKRFFDDENQHKNIGVSARKTMKTDEFLAIVQATLFLIPTIDLNKIK